MNPQGQRSVIGVATAGTQNNQQNVSSSIYDANCANFANGQCI